MQQTASVPPTFDGCVVFETSLGVVAFGMYGLDCPHGVSNILRLARMGYYNGHMVRRVVRDNFVELSAPPLTDITSGDVTSIVPLMTAEGFASHNPGHRVPLEQRHQQTRGPLIPQPGLSAASSSSSSKALPSLPATMRQRVDRPGLLLFAAHDPSLPSSGGTSVLRWSLCERLVDYLEPGHSIVGECIFGMQVLKRINSVALTERGGSGGGPRTSALVYDGTPVRIIRVRRASCLQESTLSSSFLSTDQPLGRLFIARQGQISSTGSVTSCKQPFVVPKAPTVEGGEPEDEDEAVDFPQYNAAETFGCLSSGDDDDTDGEKRLLDDPVEREAHLRRIERTHGIMLQLMHDIPDADIAPPDNVLFVCRLNPVTVSEDLEIVFRQFGSIQSCEVIRDPKTGRSLNYAFIEFATRRECERAYKKMDNVLIDDARIHVDFSQSVAKVWAATERQKKQQQHTSRGALVDSSRLGQKRER